MSSLFQFVAKLGLLAIITCGVFLPTTSGAQTQENNSEVWRQQTISEFEEWRESIPDYEKRLYDRVKKINKRTVQLTRIMIAGFLITLIVFGGGLYLIFSRIDLLFYMKETGGARNLGNQESPPVLKASPGENLRQGNHRLLLQIERNQKSLRQAVNSLTDYLLESQAFEKEVDWLRQSAAERLNELGASSNGSSKGIEKNQTDLARALEEIKTYWDDFRKRSHGLSRLVETSEKKLAELDDALPKLSKAISKDLE